MPDIEQIHYVNAAQAVNKGVSGSDGLKATTICVIEDSAGGIHVGAVTTYDTTDDGERQAAALAVTSALVPADEPEAVENEAADPAAPADAVNDPPPVADPATVAEAPAQPEASAADAPADSTTAADPNASVTSGTGNDTVTADTADNDTVTAAAGNDAIAADPKGK